MNRIRDVLMYVVAAVVFIALIVMTYGDVDLNDFEETE